jgi:hypothetical protein
MNRCGIIISNLQFGTQFAKRSAVKLLSVVSNKGMWDAKPTYDRAPKEYCYIVGGDGCEGFSLRPFGEVVHCNKKEFPPSFSQWHGFDYVNPHFTNGQGEVIGLSFSEGFFITRANL